MTIRAMPAGEVGISTPVLRGMLMGTPTGPGGGPVRPDDLDVTLAVLRDMGPQQEQAVIGEFLDRLGSAIDERVDARVEAQTSAMAGPEQRPSSALPVVSILSGIPVTAIVMGITQGSAAGILVLVVAWVAIAAVNLAHGRRT